MRLTRERFVRYVMGKVDEMKCYGRTERNDKDARRWSWESQNDKGQSLVQLVAYRRVRMLNEGRVLKYSETRFDTYAGRQGPLVRDADSGAWL